jgi:hypothetical protein
MLQRYVIVRVAYERDATGFERSLRWLVPELGDAGLTMTADARGGREWAGVIDGDTYARLADRWDLDDKPEQTNGAALTEDERPASHTYAWDGMEWETAGSSPIIYMSLRVGDPLERELAFGR